LENFGRVIIKQKNLYIGKQDLLGENCAMTIIGLMGAMNCGKTSVLKMFVDYVENKKISKIKGGMDCIIEKQDFGGESEIAVPEGEEEYSKTITPNKVVFIESKSNTSHTLFAPGGDKDRAVIRMGIITISRIARQIVGLFALDQDLKDQFELYDLIRYMPKEIAVCLNKYDLLEGSENEKKEMVEKTKNEIEAYFKKRRVLVKEFFQTCAIDKPEFKEYNDNTARMILHLAQDRKP
jgi:GTPase SAR1 family protein